MRASPYNQLTGNGSGSYSGPACVSAVYEILTQPLIWSYVLTSFGLGLIAGFLSVSIPAVRAVGQKLSMLPKKQRSKTIS